MVISKQSERKNVDRWMQRPCELLGSPDNCFFYYSKPRAHRKEESSVSSFVAGVKRLRHRVLEHALPFFQCVHGFLLGILCAEVLTLAISGEFLFHLVEERRARAGAAAQFRSIAGRVDVGERLAERHRRHVFLHQCLADRVERLVRAFGDTWRSTSTFHW